MNLTDFLIPPQIKLALKLLPVIVIVGLVIAFLWQRNALTRAQGAVETLQHAADAAVTDNELLAKQADTSAAAARALTLQLQIIRTRYDHVRTQLAGIPASACFDGRLPDPAIGLLAYPIHREADPAADAGQPGRP